LARVLRDHQAPTAGIDVGRDTSVSDIANGLFTIMDALSVVAILLSIMLLLSTIMALVTEQIQYIGTMKAIGARRGQVIRHYMAVVLLYAIIGTGIGLVVGTAGGYLLANYLGGLVNLNIGPLEVSPWQILESCLIGLGVPLLAAVLPVYFGTRITVKQALSAYGVENAQRSGGWSKITKFFFGGLPQTMQFGARGLFRRRARMVLTLITLSIAGAAFLSVQTASYSFDNFLSQTHDTYQFNVMVSLSDTYPLSRFQQVLSSVPNMGRIEPLSQNTVSTDWGDALLTGVQLNTQIYQKQLVSGRWFTSSDQNDVLISKDAADRSGLTVGQYIDFNTPLFSTRWHIIGIIKDYSGIGPNKLGTLIAPITQVNALMQLAPDVTQTVMLRSTLPSPTPDQIDDMARQIDNAMSSAGYLADVTTAQQQIEENQSKYQVIYTLLDVVAIIIALVGAISLSNTLAMSVMERRREIGILRSMGAAGRKVAAVFWTEGTTLGILAWVLAVIVGIPAAYGIVLIQAKVLAPVPFAFNPINIAEMFGIILILASLASVGPVLAAARVRIAQTLRYE
ncbi:MAG TPA: FtsX-like permease family protein, partial [Ktedonobacteraceae bacterium]|nr:FtsX-like permease family protein [Ktedonobacteraceae bacterium]